MKELVRALGTEAQLRQFEYKNKPSHKILISSFPTRSEISETLFIADHQRRADEVLKIPQIHLYERRCVSDDFCNAYECSRFLMQTLLQLPWSDQKCWNLVSKKLSVEKLRKWGLVLSKEPKVGNIIAYGFHDNPDAIPETFEHVGLYCDHEVISKWGCLHAYIHLPHHIPEYGNQALFFEIAAGSKHFTPTPS